MTHDIQRMRSQLRSLRAREATSGTVAADADRLVKDVATYIDGIEHALAVREKCVEEFDAPARLALDGWEPESNVFAEIERVLGLPAHKLAATGH